MSGIDHRKRSRISNEQSDSDSDSESHPSKKKSINDDRSLKHLSEREREAELLKRHEELERQKHHEEISKRLKAKSQPTLEMDNDIYAEDDEEEDRSSMNHRQQINAAKQEQTEHKKTLQELVEKRKKTSNVRLDQKKKWNVKDVYNSESSSSSDEETTRRRSRSPSKDESNRKQQETINKRGTKISNKNELKSMILTRYRMEKWCHAPFFSEVAKGAFVRINIGQNNGTAVYRICEIRDVVETAKVYDLDSTRTNKGLRLKHGDHERVFRLKFVSNKEISDAEFTKWREASLKKGIELPSLYTMEKKRENIEKYKNYSLNHNDIEKIIKEKSRFLKAPINYAVTKNELLAEIQIAEDNGQHQKAAELTRKLQEIEDRAEELNRKRTENISVIAEINRQNRLKTQQNIEMALTREASEHRNETRSDPFTRRRCAPVLVTRAPQTKEELIRELHNQRAAEEAAALAKKNRTAAEETQRAVKIHSVQPKVQISSRFENELDSSLPTSQRGTFDVFSDKTDELFASHNFELEDEI